MSISQIAKSSWIDIKSLRPKREVERDGIDIDFAPASPNLARRGRGNLRWTLSDASTNYTYGGLHRTVFT